MCEHPIELPARISKRGGDSHYWPPMVVNCGSCPYCLKCRAREWAMRLRHERLYHGSSLFCTFTYDREHIPSDYRIRYKDIKDFNKRLRERLKIVDVNVKYKFFCACEYGELKGRPHYHMIIFGLKKCHKQLIQESWGNGFVHIGVATPKSIAYCSQYALKKAKSSRKSEKLTVSQGLGRRWCEDNKDKFLSQRYILDGKYKYPIPRYYFKCLNIDRQKYYAESRKAVAADTILRDLKDLKSDAQNGVLRRRKFAEFSMAYGHIDLGDYIYEATDPYLEYCRNRALQYNLNLRTKLSLRKVRDYVRLE